MRKLVGLLGLALFILVPGVKADGMLIYRPAQPVSETGQRAVIYFDGSREVLEVSTSFSGTAGDFVWVVPVPSKPEVVMGEEELFQRLQRLTSTDAVAPLGSKQIDIGTNFMMPINPGVNVIEQKSVDVYDVSVLDASNAEALAGWLRNEGYPYPEDKDNLLSYYVAKKWYFVAAKVNNSSWLYGNGTVNSGQLKPLKISFASKQIVFPLKISGLNSGGGNGGSLITPSPTPQSDQFWTRMGDKEYKRIWTGNGTWGEAKVVCEQEGGRLASISNQAENDFVVNLCGKGNMCRLGHTNPGGYCSSEMSLPQRGAVMSPVTTPKMSKLEPWLDGKKVGYTNWETGEPFAYCAEDCLEIDPNGKWNNEWCNNQWKYEKYSICQRVAGEQSGIGVKISEKMMMPIVATPYPYQSPVPIELYVLADHKQAADGFWVEYAGTVTKEAIQSWAVDDGGKAWINPEGKMYLTKLTQSLSPWSMNQDVVFTKAPNDDPVGGGVLDEGYGRKMRIVLVFGGVLVAELVLIGYLMKRERLYV